MMTGINSPQAHSATMQKRTKTHTESTLAPPYQRLLLNYESRRGRVLCKQRQQYERFGLDDRVVSGN